MTVSCFKFHSTLGVGAYGKVMLASAPGKDSLVAVKMIRKNRWNLPHILKERRILELARKSPFLCHGHAAFQTQKYGFLVMDYMTGGSMEDYLQNVGCMNENMATFYAAEMVCGIQFLHSRGIIHRDLKPANVLFDGEGHIKICDFGLATEGIFGDAVSTEVYGTLPYLAPEILKFGGYGVAVDWWSFGVVLFRMLNGAFPFYNSYPRKLVIRSIVSDAPKFTKKLSKKTKGIIKHLLKKDPQQRMIKTENIRQHKFFHGIIWDNIESRNTAPPYQPAQLSNIQQSRCQVMEITEDSISPSNIQHLPDFSFVASDWMH